MVFSSNIFLFVFFPIVLIIYFNPIVKNIKFKNFTLLIASIIFYAWGEPIFVFLMIFSVFINWIIGLLIGKYRNRTKLLVAISTIFNLSIIIIFKYLNFITENIALLTGEKNIITKIALPIGISFFTFQMMSYIYDVAMKKGKVQKNFWDLLLYISMFPQLIAGPIVRYETIAKEITNRTTNSNDLYDGTCRFIKGLSKKVLIANNIAILADTVFEYQISNMSTALAWLGIVAYTLQIYFDFSGYSDMAIGLGRIFGFHFLENFNHPYQSKSVTEFWRRWHISMGTWFRDYVYFPLGGSRVKSKFKHIFNLLVVWLLTGLWHGANWTFIIWGLMYFIILVFEKITKLDKKMDKIGHLWTMFFVMIGWVLFRCDTVSYAFEYIGTLLGINGIGLISIEFWDLLSQFWIFIAIGGILSTINIENILKEYLKSENREGNVYTFVYTLSYIIILLITISAVIKGGNNPFIYFNF